MHIDNFIEIGRNFFSGGNGCPLRKGEMPMYVTYDDLFQFGILIVTIIGLVVEIYRKGKKNPPLSQSRGYFLKLQIARGTT